MLARERFSGTPEESDKSPEHQSLLREFGQSFLHSAIQAPINGATQLIDGIAGTNLHDRSQLIAEPKKADFGSVEWHVQQAGSAIGGVTAFIGVNALVGRAAGAAKTLDFVGESRVASSTLNVLSNNQFAKSLASGAITDGLLRESDPSKSLVTARLEQAGIGAVTYGALTGAAAGIRGASSVGLLGRGLTDRIVSSNIASNALAGIPAGLLNAELTTGFNASHQDLYKSAYTFAFSGATIGGVRSLTELPARNEAPRAEAPLKPITSPPDINGLPRFEMKTTAHATLLTAQEIITGPIKLVTKEGLEIPTLRSPQSMIQDFARAVPLESAWTKVRQIFRLDQPEPENHGITLFLDGGGANGWRHIGVLKAIEEQNIKVDRIYGVSIGSIVASMWARGYHSHQIQRAFFREFESPLVKETLPQEANFSAFRKGVDPTPMVQHWVNKYNLTPSAANGATDRPSLHIGAFLLRERRLHWFEGKDMPMVTAIKSSMGIPGLFSNLKVPRELLGMGEGKPVTMLDGGIRHITPEDLPQDKPIVISRLHSRELGSQLSIGANAPFVQRLRGPVSNLLHRNVDAPDGNAVVILPKHNEINSLAFHQPESVVRAMIDDGYTQAKSTLESAIKRGIISPSRRYRVEYPLEMPSNFATVPSDTTFRIPS